jgi:palmitoyltransferase
MDTAETTESGTSRENVVALARSVEQIQSDIRNLRISSPSRANRDPERVETVDGPMGLDAHFDENASTIGTTPKASVLPENGPALEADYRVMYTADYGAQILQEGKKDLLRRLEPDSERPVRSRRTRPRSPPPAMPAERMEHSPIPDPPDAPLALPSDDERDPLSEEDDSEDEYPVPGDDGRGLLTDVPLILGPGEIEVLPMIIMSGIVPPRSDQEGYGTTEQEVTAIKNMHTVRCHLLLAQDNGRNLLRELLIFVAAWDLRDDELYFKLMMKIIEAVLTNGLLPFSYHAFRESKDIISPAQAVIMKLLTSIFRSRQSETARSRGLTVTPRPSRKPVGEATPYPERNDVHMVSFLFTEFRRHIIPQTCALIFLQGQIRNGTVSPDEFPLNLWDMERMYEGIYQYLEFFAILTEHDVWKQMMADWEITSELVTLLEELDAAIPRSTPKHQPNYKQRAASKALVQYGPDPVHGQAVAIERPYDVSATTAGATAIDAAQDEQADAAAGAPQQPAYAPPPPEDEPSDFEWRNLKKLAVLVLSSLVWKSPPVQAQLGTADSSGHKGRGVRALLNCCKVDDYNPFIREHAIMALRFALENNAANQDVVRAMEKLGTETGYGGQEGYKLDVPREVLDLNGYETFVDKRGQVQLKKKDGVLAGVVRTSEVRGEGTEVGEVSDRGRKEKKEVVL